MGIDTDVLRDNGVAAVLWCDDPRGSFIRIVSACFAPHRPQGIAPSAVISGNARIGEKVYIGALVTIGDGVVIGNGTAIYSGSHIYKNVSIGANVTIHSGTVIGADGFGYHRGDDGAMCKFPHIGTVYIEDDVEIGANTCIDRGALGATRIGRGAKIDNLVHIGHNASVGQDAVIIAHSLVGGSTQIGDRAWLAPSTSIRDGLVIGDDALIGLGAVVTKDVASGETVYGAPARTQNEQRRLLKHWKGVAMGESKKP